MGSQLQLCTTVGSQLIGKMHKVLVASCLAAAAFADAEPGYLGYGYGYGYGIGGVSTGVGLHPTGSVYESRSAQGLGKRSADAEPGYYTQNYWPSVVTPYGYSTCYGCRGKRSAEPGYLGLGMDMVLEVSAEVLVSTQLDQSMSPDQHRVSVVDTCTRLLLLLFLCNMLEINIF